MRPCSSLALLLLAVPALAVAQTTHASTHMPTKTQNPAGVHRSALVIDTHADTPQRFVDEHFDLSDPLGTLEWIDSVKQQAARHPKEIEFVTTPAGIEYAHRTHKFAALMGIEGGHSIEDSIPLLRQYYALGVRYMTLTWSNSTDWADSSGDINDASIPHTREGLTEFGKDVVYEMNRLGMMVDISHVSDRTL